MINLETRYSIDEIKSKYNPIITVFGSSTCNENSKLYVLASNIGEIIAKNGYTTASGGYTCVMSGIAKGSTKNGGRSIGITTDEITSVKPSKYLTEEFREYTLMSRLEILINISDAFVVLPGSSGTLTELALVWDKQKLGLIPVKPCYLIGKTWHKIFNIIFKNNDSLVNKSHWKKDEEVENACVLINELHDLNNALKN
ncbi:MAG: LOG family protein ORF6 in fasciation locus [Candidatus Heimdallarchaeota archaeon LC_3]|nr:MAG: LOG family protein ORF6 in fasciation locus [Candidatus Heimdallarchaeota archaeon LC_3]OLS21039.1 MAG: LOG family protein ORF6 in fasciation locus [Candidatus Heimdallarchaeota archaeon LC_3]